LTSQSLPWIEPLELATCVSDPCFVLLYSSAQTDYSGQYSYLACNLAEKLEVADFSAMEAAINARPYHDLSDRWFTLLSYGLKNSLEDLPADQPGWFGLPLITLMRFNQVYEFDHHQQSLTMYGSGRPLLPQAKIPPIGYIENTVATLDSSMSDEEYLAKAASIIDAIARGDLYQANLTRKYSGSLERTPDYFSLFKRLCEISPAPYSAYIRMNEQHILSSSPELFMKCTPMGYIQTRPIKGTAARFASTVQDAASREALIHSEKDRAENLMIVDLMRNDLAKCCLPGSIEAPRLFEVTSHATIHHMSSTISGQKAPGYSHIDAIKACFPPGSMTGAPKIKAMKLCSNLEKLERGLYSGAIGWVDAQGAAELSVVIRTLLLKGREFEFQVGGGIVADSTPQGELKEIHLKASGIAQSLGLKAEDLQSINYALNA